MRRLARAAPRRATTSPSQTRTARRHREKEHQERAFQLSGAGPGQEDAGQDTAQQDRLGDRRDGRQQAEGDRANEVRPRAPGPQYRVHVHGEHIPRFAGRLLPGSARNGPSFTCTLRDIFAGAR